jgi:tRNA pseudouridine55 synthase
VAIDGILNLDKPKGKTSFEVVAVVRRVSGERRVGHGGTLDPEATGVLPIYLGQGTRLVEFLVDARKVYQAEIELGVSTDTYDATGRTVGRGDTSALTREDVEAATYSFKGSVEQVPPMYSAVKHQGVPLYRWARAGIELPRKTRKVEFYRIEVLKWRPPLLSLEVECGKGTYIRSLAHDLGAKLGCGAHLSNLVRISSGPFHIRDAITISEVESAFKSDRWTELIQSIDIAVYHLPAVTVTNDEECSIVNGRPLMLVKQDSPSEGQCRAYSRDGRFLAILSRDAEGECWRPKKVFTKGLTKA